jgi:hypothetical protein
MSFWIDRGGFDRIDANLQKEVYLTLETRKRINEQLKDSIKPFCPVLMRGVVEEIEKSEVVI